MSGATFVHCPGCGRLMLGQHGYPQPHDCPGKPARDAAGHLSRTQVLHPGSYATGIPVGPQIGGNGEW